MPNLYQCLTYRDNHNWGGRVKTRDGNYYFHDHGAKVLGVAHLDTVFKAPPIKDGSIIFAPQLDDRLGVYCLLDWLPRMGIQLDVLLTTGEECCRSTGAWFDPPRDYNWIVEFDRAGADVVFYQYHEQFSPHWTGKIGCGSFSDIAFMDFLGVCGVNIGIGYHEQHTYNCYADLNDTHKQLKRFAKFFQKNENNRFTYDPRWDETFADPLPKKKRKSKYKYVYANDTLRAWESEHSRPVEDFDFDPYSERDNWEHLNHIHREC
jgi:hypothetical protein